MRQQISGRLGGEMAVLGWDRPRGCKSVSVELSCSRAELGPLCLTPGRDKNGCRILILSGRAKVKQVPFIPLVLLLNVGLVVLDNRWKTF